MPGYFARLPHLHPDRIHHNELIEPQSDAHIDGVPDKDDQASPREHIKKAVRGMMLESESKKIQSKKIQ